jgi:hypothetical protein
MSGYSNRTTTARIAQVACVVAMLALPVLAQASVIRVADFEDVTTPVNGVFLVLQPLMSGAGSAHRIRVSARLAAQPKKTATLLVLSMSMLQRRGLQVSCYCFSGHCQPST